MARTTPESLLISAIINTQDPTAGRTYGILPIHLIGFRDEYEWIQDYYQTYRVCPTQTELKTKFPEFPFSEDQTEVRWPASDVKLAFAARDLSRRCMKALGELTKGQVPEAYEHFHGLTLDIASSAPQNVLIDYSYLDDYERSAEVRLELPWSTLQNVTEGIGPGELWYWAARQGQGKSSQLIDIAAHAVQKGHTVLMYSLEMTKRQVQTRMHANLGHRLGYEVDEKAMRHRRFDPLLYKQVIQAIEDEVPGQMMIHDSSMGRVSPGVISNRIQEADLVIIDYVGLMYTDEGVRAIKDYRNMAEISNELVEIVQNKKGRIIGAAQINRAGQNYGPYPPSLEHLAQSDHLGNDGAVVVTSKRHCDGATINSVEKNRFGPSRNRFFTKYDPNGGDFREITRDEADDMKDAEED